MTEGFDKNHVNFKMSYDARKVVCASAQSYQRLYYLLIGNKSYEDLLLAQFHYSCLSL